MVFGACRGRQISVSLTSAIGHGCLVFFRISSSSVAFSGGCCALTTAPQIPQMAQSALCRYFLLLPYYLSAFAPQSAILEEQT